jgi:hypothetical protein
MSVAAAETSVDSPRVFLLQENSVLGPVGGLSKVPMHRSKRIITASPLARDVAQQRRGPRAAEPLAESEVLGVLGTEAALSGIRTSAILTLLYSTVSCSICLRLSITEMDNMGCERTGRGY